MKSALVFVFLGAFVFPILDARSENGVRCEAVKRSFTPGYSVTGVIERGIRVFQRVRETPGGPVTEWGSRSLWFGGNQALRDQALIQCREWVSRLECRHDGPTRTSYGRGGVSAKTTEWALHESSGKVIATFDDPIFFFMDSAYEKCHAELIDTVIEQVRDFGGR
jgi:hypothetical protein